MKAKRDLEVLTLTHGALEGKLSPRTLDIVLIFFHILVLSDGKQNTD